MVRSVRYRAGAASVGTPPVVKVRLERFREAQNSPDAGFAAALEEIHSGGKRGHWIWYVFPQLAGLGASAASQNYAIRDEAEAMEFLHDTELRSRLLTITREVARQVERDRPRSLRALMGSDIDTEKLVSSLTLFEHVATRLHAVEGLEEYKSLAVVARAVLAAAASEGYPRCAYTLERLGTPSRYP